jgi:23S rRNA (pseudouridine1915-N3)-methyltransferase
MAREWVVVWAGRHRRDRWDALCEEYRERVARYMPVRELAVRARKAGDGAGAGSERLESEGEAILAALPDPCRLIALDRDARPSSSESLAGWLVSSREEWPHAVAFVVGSDLGLAPAVLDRAWRRLSFGPLTLPHELARLVLWEQLYRVSAIATGSGYHRKSAGSLV